MQKMSGILALILALALCLGGLAEGASDGYAYALGDKIEDFTVTTYDGQEISLYGLLAQKEMVLLNIWATWCGPCRNEFPFMEEAYEAYADRVGIIALSCEPTDDDSVLKSFAESMGMTFYVTQDTPDLASRFGVTGIPTSIAVDRFGTICFVEAGSMPDAESFTRLFDVFLGDGYTESVLLSGLPAEKPSVAPSTEEELGAALNVAGGSLSFTNSADPYDWPMTVGEKDGRTVAAASNSGKDNSRAVVNTAVDAQAGDALCVTFGLSSESGFDLMEIRINGEAVKAFGGEKGWMTYAYPFTEAGAYDVAILYEKDEMGFDGVDTLWIDSVALLSGADAKAALAANPVYPVSDELSAAVTNAGARRIVIDDPTGNVQYNYGDLFYLVNSEEADIGLSLPAQMDPERAFVLLDYDGSVYPLADLLADGAYTVRSPIDSLETTGYCCSTLYFFSTMQDYYDMNWHDMNCLMLTYFQDEENLDVLVEAMTADENGTVLGSWAYADGDLPASGAPTESTFVIRYVDQQGNPVAGVTLQVCDDATCTLFTSGENGECAFTLAPKSWELHTLMVPAGYTGDTQTVTVSAGGEYEFVLTKN